LFFLKRNKIVSVGATASGPPNGFIPLFYFPTTPYF